MNLAEILRDISSVIFPPQCLGCAEILNPGENRIFCLACEAKVDIINGAICSVCGISFPDSPSPGHRCGDCIENKPFFSCARAVFSYESLILEAIHRFKYHRDLAVGETLASFMADFAFPDINFPEYTMIMPVPLHVKKLRQRGFNQSLILAKAIGKRHKIPVDFSLLKRHKFTESQTGMTKDERRKNIKGAFEITAWEKIAGQNIILVDDVFTTGATANECAKTLLKAKAQKVAVLTLARVLKH
jgi:ComF family protein